MDDDRNDGLKFGDGVNFNDPDDPYSSDLGFLEADEYPDDIIPSNKKRKVEPSVIPSVIPSVGIEEPIKYTSISATEPSKRPSELFGPHKVKEFKEMIDKNKQKKPYGVTKKEFAGISHKNQADFNANWNPSQANALSSLEDQQQYDEQELADEENRFREIGLSLKRKREGGKRKTSKRKTSKRKTGKRKTGKRKTGKRKTGKRKTSKRR